MTSIDKINFIDLNAQQAMIRPQVEQALINVLNHGRYVNGPEVDELEQQLSELTSVKYALSCANGTDALSLVLMAKNIKAGDAVFVPSFTFAASAEVVAHQGATPVFVDVDLDSYNMSVASLVQAIEYAKNKKLTPKVIIPVDIFGLPANHAEILKVAQEHELWVLSDAAQSFGAKYQGKSVGKFGLATTTSFFPAKPLGCYGDGGAIFTDNDELAKVIKSLKSHGQGEHRNHYVRVGVNSRLDSFQAAILLEKLKVFPNELKHRDSVAAAYSEILDNSIKTPKVESALGTTCTWAQYTVTLPEDVDRNKVIEHLDSQKIPSVIYYDTPIHKQPAYEKFVEFSPPLNNTDYLSKHVLSLPMDGYLSIEKVNYIAQSLNKALLTCKQ